MRRTARPYATSCGATSPNLTETNGGESPGKSAWRRNLDADYAALPIEVDNIEAATGTIWIGVYRSEADFLDHKHARILSVPVQNKQSLRTRISDLQIGQDYAIALFHDRNNNGELDRNFLGLPTESFAFSGELRSRWRLPHFTEVRFRFPPRGRPYDFTCGIGEVGLYGKIIILTFAFRFQNQD